MKLVLDTNVLVSALLNPRGTSSRLLLAWRRDEYELVTSGPLLAELAGVLARPYIRRNLQEAGIDASQLLTDLHTLATVVDPAETEAAVAADETDNRVLEAAVAGEADWIVSGGAHLLDLRKYREIPIVTPARMLAVLESSRLGL